MQALIDTVLIELRGMWRFRRIALSVAWGICLVGWLVVYVLPDKYESRARVNVDTRTALRPLLQGLAVDQDVESQLNQVRQALLGRANLEKVAQKVGLISAATPPWERERVVGSLASRLEIALEPPAVRDPRIPNTLYRIVYSDETRQRALQVVDTLLNSFVEDTMGTERSGTASAHRFLREQLAEYERRLAEAETNLAAFKKKNLGLVPGEEGDYFQRLQAENAQIKTLEGQLSVATSRRSELSRQLSGEIPFVPPAEGTTANRSGTTAGPQDTASRIQETQARLDEMLLRFTDKHPDVIAVRETLDALRARQQIEMAALRRGDAGAAAVAGASSNPVYQSIQLQLNQVDVEIAALRGQLNDHRRSVGELRKLVDTAPEVEAEFKRLTRDYDVTRTQYNALFERLERARLSEGAEQTGIVRFDIVDPPSAGFAPIFPNRPLFLIAVLIFAVGAGGGVAFLMHQIKPVFSSARNLADLTGMPVLGSVSRTWVEKQRAEMRHGLMRYAAASGLLLMLFIVAVAVQQPASRFLRQLL
jgi:polysaccharide chain length determinant protein (PEP-CTERM system associated)